MRNPGRRDSDDARQDRDEELAAQAAGNTDVPSDGDVVVADGEAVTAPPTPPILPPKTETAAARSDTTEAQDTNAEQPDGPVAPVDDDACDGLLFDPLLSDEPIDLAAVRADDALIDALGGGDPATAAELVDVDDPLIAMLAAWAASARPADPEPQAPRRKLAVVAEHPADEADDEIDDDTAAVAPDDGPDRVDVPAAAAVAAVPAPADPEPATVPRLRPADPEPATVPRLRPAAVHDRPEADAEPTGAEPTGAEPAVATATVPTLAPSATDAGDPAEERVPAVAGLFDRVRILRRRAAPGGHPLPTGHPLHRAAVAVVVALLAISGAAAAGGTARPGDIGYPMTRVFFAERARSLEAAQVVSAGLDRARVFLENRRPDLAAQELARVDVALPDVRDEEGHTQLVGQQHVLEAAVALTPPYVPDPAASATGTAPARRDPGTSILAESALPPVTSGDATPDAVPPPAGTDGTAAGGDATDDTDVLAAPESPTSESPTSESPTSESSTSGSSTSGDGDPTTAADGTDGSDGAAQPTTTEVGGSTDEGGASADPEPTGDTEAPSTSTATSTSTSEPATDPDETDDPTGTATTTSPPSATPDAPDPTTNTGKPADTGKPTDTPDKSDPPDTGDSGGADDTGSGSVAAVPARASAAFSVRPAANGDPADGGPADPSTRRTGKPAPTAGPASTGKAATEAAPVVVETRAHGSVVAKSSSPVADDKPARKAAPEPADVVVVTTVPPPAPAPRTRSAARTKTTHTGPKTEVGTRTKARADTGSDGPAPVERAGTSSRRTHDGDAGASGGDARKTRDADGHDVAGVRTSGTGATDTREPVRVTPDR